MSEPYLSWLRRQPCVGCRREPAGEAHHTGQHGLAQKPPDEFAVPLCHECHMALHDLKGPFRGFEKRHRHAWEAMVLAATRSRFLGAACHLPAPEEGAF